MMVAAHNHVLHIQLILYSHTFINDNTIITFIIMHNNNKLMNNNIIAITNSVENESQVNLIIILILKFSSHMYFI